MGLSGNAGNTENLTFNAFWQLMREDSMTRAVITYDGTFGKAAGADFSLRVTTILHFNTSFLYLRTEEPLPRSDGTVPEKNDYQVVVGISLRIG